MTPFTHRPLVALLLALGFGSHQAPPPLEFTRSTIVATRLGVHPELSDPPFDYEDDSYRWVRASYGIEPRIQAPNDAVLLTSGARQVQESTARYRAWLHSLRQVCTECGVPLIFDEVYPGFRLAVGGGKLRRQDLDGHGAIEPCIARAVDLTHAARTDRADDFIGAEASARIQSHEVESRL